MEGGGPHLLSLKVMRVSRPSLAHAWTPFFSSSPSFSAHSTASILSLQGVAPLPDHPKTLRDLSHATELLTLPSAFGAIQLGETFSSCLAVNNEAHTDINGVVLKVEIQTASSKILLAEIERATLNVGDTLESIVTHEIKELGQHVLACTVSYQMPGARTGASHPLETQEPSVQTFRKFYKFAVANPLSVKTKVHTPKSPSALMSLSEREKVFLEVHIQNQTPDSIWFERMRFDCADRWTSKDINDDSLEDPIVLQPQDIRQYIYILTPVPPNPIEPIIYAPGSVIPLGRLDISWRSPLGEPGRLLTSMLSRRIPLPPPMPSASAVPPYLKRTSAPVTAPRSPIQSRPTSPTPSGPNRASTMILPTRSQSPAPMIPPTVSDIEASLIVREPPLKRVGIRKPFSIPFTLSISVPPGPERVLTLAIQHVQPNPASSTAKTLQVAGPPSAVDGTSSGMSTPSREIGTRTFNYALAHQKLALAASYSSKKEYDAEDESGASTPRNEVDLEHAISLPPPYSDVAKQHGVIYHGPSAVVLPPVRLAPTEPDDVSDASGEARGHAKERRHNTQDLELEYLPIKSGFTSIGGVRVLLVDDTSVDERRKTAVVLKQWDVIAEVWVDG